MVQNDGAPVKYPKNKGNFVYLEEEVETTKTYQGRERTTRT